MSINERPLDLIRGVLLRLPIKHVARLSCVSKLWHSLISDPDFANTHVQFSPSPTRRCFFIQNSEPLSVDLDALFHDNDNGHHTAASVRVPLPLRKPVSEFDVLGSCMGFIVLHQDPHFFIIWNPLTGSHKRISYYRIVRRYVASNRNSFMLLGKTLLFGFGYDASKDDYLVVLAWMDKKEEDHLDFFSLRTNSWKSFKVAIPYPLRRNRSEPGLFINGAIHWLPCLLHNTGDDTTTVVAFDLTKRSFSEIPVPEQVVRYSPSYLVVLGGCLALYLYNDDDKTEIWVMTEYKVQSSWTLYEISSIFFEPMCLSRGGDIIGFDGPRGFAKYNVKGELLKHYAHFASLPRYIIYSESSLPVPNDSDEKKKGM